MAPVANPFAHPPTLTPTPGGAPSNSLRASPFPGRLSHHCTSSHLLPPPLPLPLPSCLPGPTSCVHRYVLLPVGCDQSVKVFLVSFPWKVPAAGLPGNMTSRWTYT